MDVNLRHLYDQYLIYFQEMQADLERQLGTDLNPRYRPVHLSFYAFQKTWDRWGDQGDQDYWRCRFERGYQVWARETIERLKAVFISPESGLVSADRAA